MNDPTAPVGTGGCPTVTAVRGSLVWFGSDPFHTSSEQALEYVEDGLLVCQDGKITDAGPYDRLIGRLPTGTTVVHYRDKVILPGFVDLHVHYAQTRIIGAYGDQLLKWLNKHVYPEEVRFADPGYARRTAELFCDQILRNGTTTAMVNCATYPASVDALFEETTRRGMRVAAGKVLMDRNARSDLLDASPLQGYEESEALIRKWHGVGRSLYAITPRFALACTGEMLRLAGKLWDEHPGTLLQAHLAENAEEVEEVRSLFPEREDYVDVYEHFGLLGRGAVFAHAVHLGKREWGRLSATGSGVAHCPTSNLFLGSGLFPMRSATDRRHPVRTGLGTDVGAGTSLSLVQTANEAYKVGQLGVTPMDGTKLFYLATLGGASAMGLDGVVGSLAPGNEADFVVLDPSATQLLATRTATSETVDDLLFALAQLGDDRAVAATYVSGRLAHERNPCLDAKPDRKRQRRWTKSRDMGLRWLTYEESAGWSKDLEVPNAWSPYAPGVEAYKGRLYCLHQNTFHDESLWWDVYDKDTGAWRGDRALHDALGDPVPSHGPLAVSHANDYLYYVHHRTSSDTRLWWARYNIEGETGWSPDRVVKAADGREVRASGASLTVYDGLLYCVLRSAEGRLRWLTQDTGSKEWSTERDVPGGFTSSRPPVVERFKDQLYCVHDRGDDQLHWLTYDSASGNWSESRRIEDVDGNPVRTSYTPAITRYNDYLYCVFHQEDASGWGRLWWTRYDKGKGWSRPVRAGDAISSPGFDVSAYHGPLFCVHRG
ncbi:guanine deaminase [Nocardiopsis ganjiahuensis]|uniref:guanine deaminase n=1 Tax=Nocardiopsis ganjiahuensis TaxID=239984 RepID=UPI0003496919|nr:guanine deaminase [Nocardiopsis ganjiahuensis]